MDINKMTLEELEKLSHLDIAYNILKHDKIKLSTIDLLKQICKCLNYGDTEFENLIGDFYTALNLDKRFILIDGVWDLTENHAIKVIIEDDIDDDIDIEEEIEDEDIEEEIEDDIVSDDIETMEDVEDDIDDDLEELSIVEEDEIEEES